MEKKKISIQDLTYLEFRSSASSKLLTKRTLPGK